MTQDQKDYQDYLEYQAFLQQTQEQGLRQQSGNPLTAIADAFTDNSMPDVRGGVLHAANMLSGSNLQKLPAIQKELELAQSTSPTSVLIGKGAGFGGQMSAGQGLASGLSALLKGPIAGQAAAGFITGAAQNPGEDDSASKRLAYGTLGGLLGAGTGYNGQKIDNASRVSKDISLVKDPVAREKATKDLLTQTRQAYQQQTVDPLIAARNKAVSEAPESAVDVAKLSARTGDPELDAMVNMMGSGKMTAEELAQNRQAFANIPQYNKAGIPTNADAAAANASYLRSLEDPSVVSANKAISEAMRPINQLNELAGTPSEVLKYSPFSTKEAILGQLQAGSGINILDRAKQLQQAESLVMPELSDALKYPLASIYDVGRRAAVEIPALAGKAWEALPGTSRSLGEVIAGMGKNIIPVSASLVELNKAVKRANDEGQK